MAGVVAGVVPRPAAGAGAVVAGAVPPRGAVVVAGADAGVVVVPPRPVAGVAGAGFAAVPAALPLAFSRVLISSVMLHSLLEYTMGLFGAERSYTML